MGKAIAESQETSENDTVEFSWCLQHMVLQERRHVSLKPETRTEVRQELEITVRPTPGHYLLAECRKLPIGYVVSGASRTYRFSRLLADRVEELRRAEEDLSHRTPPAS